MNMCSRAIYARRKMTCDIGAPDATCPIKTVHLVHALKKIRKKIMRHIEECVKHTPPCD